MKAPFGSIVWPFSVSQTISWATMFYIFPAMFTTWEEQLQWSKAELSAALTLALILSALFAPVAGRIIDRGYFVLVHLGGTFIGILALLLLSQVQQLWQFYAVWALMGFAMAGVLYEPCFAILTRTFKLRARAAITRVTLVAGLAGTVCFPASHFLIGLYGWRGATLIFAAALTLIAVPLAWKASLLAQNYARSISEEEPEDPRAVTKLIGLITFWMLAISYLAFSLNHAMILTHLLPLLDDRGVSDAAAIIAASFIGPMQVVGRLVMMSLERYVSTVAVAAGALFSLTISGTAIYWVGAWGGLLLVFVTLQGAGNGISSIVRPLLNAELLGRKNFGLISGIMALPFIGGFAAGPFVSALIWKLGGYDWVLLFAIGISIAGIITLILANIFATHND